MKTAGKVLAILTFVPISLLAESKVTLGSLPPALQASIKKETTGATIQSVVKEKEDGRLQYEVETKLNGKSRNLVFLPSGELFETEDETDLNSIPAPARDAIQKKAADGKIASVEKLVTDKGTKTYYEAAIVAKGGKKIEYSVHADGSSKTKKEDGDKD